MSGILVYALHYDGAINKNSLGAVSEGARLASELGTECHAIVVGDKAGLSDELVGSLGSYGATKVFRAEGPEGLLTTIAGVASLLVTNLIVVAPVLLLARRWRLPFGTVTLLATMGLFDMVGTTLSGWLSDKWDNRLLLTWYYGLRVLSLLFLPFAFDLGFAGFGFAGLALFAAFYGLDWIATVPPTVRLAARCFGEENAPVMFGWIAAMHQLGAASAAWLAGITRVDTGSYMAAFVGAGAVVTKDVPPRVVVVGSPARVLRNVPENELLDA